MSKTVFCEFALLVILKTRDLEEMDEDKLTRVGWK